MQRILTALLCTTALLGTANAQAQDASVNRRLQQLEQEAARERTCRTAGGIGAAVGGALSALLSRQDAYGWTIPLGSEVGRNAFCYGSMALQTPEPQTPALAEDLPLLPTSRRWQGSSSRRAIPIRVVEAYRR